MNLRGTLRRFLPRSVRDLRLLLISMRPLAERHCPICQYEGMFKWYGRPPRIDASCPRCGSLERHRLFWLWLNKNDSKVSEPILHFAPEAVIVKKLRRRYKSYQTADLYSEADLRLNIEKIELPSSSTGTVICNHVLEHVADLKALAEINRIMADGGLLVCSVPIIESWDKTYENTEVESASDKEIHFGQHDHIRYYGNDFRCRLKAAGFLIIEEFTAEGADVVRYGLLRGDKIFVCCKSQ